MVPVLLITNITGVKQNRELLGLKGAHSEDRKVLVNEFISEVLFPQDISVDQEIYQCIERLAQVTIVNIRMSRHDAIVLTKYRKPVVMSAISSIGKSMEHIRLFCVNLSHFASISGNLMSMYFGQSFLSLFEMIFWILKAILMVACG